MRRHAAAFASGLIALATLSAPPVAQTRGWEDFGLGVNAENQACRAVWRFEGARAPSAADIYCGAWQAPSGTVRMAQPGQAQALARDCAGEARPLGEFGGVALIQVACERASGQVGVGRYGMIAMAGGKTVYGMAYPADWGPMVRAARVILGADARDAVAAPQQVTPGLAEILAVYPEGAPGQGAGFNYELLRRRAYEQNVAWSFGAAGRDFLELLRAHQRIAPEDKAGEAEILAEIGLNLSDTRRFGDAADMLDRAEADARASGDALLVSKITNYRAIDALNQGNNDDAMRLAGEANAQRARLGALSAQGGPASSISAADARAIEARAPTRGPRALVVILQEVSTADRSAVLSAQASAIAGTAARALSRPDAGAFLTQAQSYLRASNVQPAWLAGQIYEERSALSLSEGNAAGAEAEAREGLARVRVTAGETRVEARLLMTLERAQYAQGNLDGALASGRQAVRILERQAEAPGMPSSVAAGHLEALFTAWERSHDQALAAEYFETLTLVWDGAASRAAAQLAARLGQGTGGDSIRLYQDAERAYRAALTRRARLSPESGGDEIAAADKAVSDASTALQGAESTVRSRSPRYLELLSPKVATADLQKVLGAGEGYVRIVLTAERGYGALVTGGAVQPYRIDMTERAASRAVTAIRKSAVIKGSRLPDYDLVGAESLYRALFAPIGQPLAGLNALHIDGGGILSALPMGALIVSAPSDEMMERIALDQDYTGVDWLARHYAIDTALGPAAFLRTRLAQSAPASTAVAAFGDFRPNPTLAATRIAADHGLSERCRLEIQNSLTRLRALPSTAEEARSAAAAFGASSRASTGSDFTDAAFLDGQGTQDAEVLVLATHGVLGLSSCFAEPALLASVGPNGDGLIEASELLERNLKARLVILSACDTAGGGGAAVADQGLADGGEALSGLARAFIYAGAPSIIATQWPVDASASALQTGLLLRTAANGSIPVAQALGAAQAQLYEDAETAHPFFWSGFVLIGDGGQKLR